MERDWQFILDHHENDEDDVLANLLHDDDGIFEALWNYVMNGNQEDAVLSAVISLGTALEMLLIIGTSKDEMCQALVMNK